MCSLKFKKIQRKTPVSEPIFSFNFIEKEIPAKACLYEICKISEKTYGRLFLDAKSPHRSVMNQCIESHCQIATNHCLVIAGANLLVKGYQKPLHQMWTLKGIWIFERCLRKSSDSSYVMADPKEMRRAVRLNGAPNHEMKLNNEEETEFLNNLREFS